jgi:hypothetical protein
MSRDALVVGINTYSYERLSNLTAPAIDAEAIAFVWDGFGSAIAFVGKFAGIAIAFVGNLQGWRSRFGCWFGCDRVWLLI